MQQGIARAENSHIWEREEYEHYVEPEWCSRRLFEVERFEGEIYDPSCGFGRIPESARVAGYLTTATDLVDRGYQHMNGAINFFSVSRSVPNIVSNPPFDIFRQYAMQALKLAERKVALIWLVRTLPAARWLEDTPLARIWLLTPGPSMPPGFTITAGQKPGGGKQDFCWLVFDKAHAGPASIGWLHRDGGAA